MVRLSSSALSMLALASLVHGRPMRPATSLRTMNLTEDFLSHHFQQAPTTSISPPQPVSITSNASTSATQIQETSLPELSRPRIYEEAPRLQDLQVQIHQLEDPQQNPDDDQFRKFLKQINGLVVEHDHPARAADFYYLNTAGFDKGEGNEEIENLQLGAAQEEAASDHLAQRRNHRRNPAIEIDAKKRPPLVSWEGAINTRERLVALQEQIEVNKARLVDVRRDIKAGRAKKPKILESEVKYYEGRITQHEKEIVEEREKLGLQEGGVR